MNKNINNTNIEIGDLVKHSKKYCDGLHSIKDRICSRRMVVIDIKYDLDMEQTYVRVYNICGLDLKYAPDKDYEWTVEQLEKIC